MENTLENKAKFFALYVLQGVFVNGLNIKGWLTTLDLHYISQGSIDGHLELKSLSSISDEDFTEVMCLIFPFQPRSSFKRGKFYTDHLNIQQADFLRSRSYALPWMGLSVEELVNRGWIKLKGGTK